MPISDSEKIAAVILAGGSGRRFGSDKLAEKIAGVPVIVRSLRAFQNCALISDIILVARQDSLEPLYALCEKEGITKLNAVVPGGAERAQSCMAGLNALAEDVTVVAIHDGARPLVTETIIEDALAAAAEYGAAVPSVPLKDTVKICQSNTVLSTPDRSTLAAVQTPQCFRKEIICRAMRQVIADGAAVTDDASAVEYIGETVKLSAGSEENLKITTRSDLLIAEMILKGRE